MSISHYAVGDSEEVKSGCRLECFLECLGGRPGPPGLRSWWCGFSGAFDLLEDLGIDVLRSLRASRVSFSSPGRLPFLLRLLLLRHSHPRLPTSPLWETRGRDLHRSHSLKVISLMFVVVSWRTPRAAGIPRVAVRFSGDPEFLKALGIDISLSFLLSRGRRFHFSSSLSSSGLVSTFVH